MAVLEVFVPSSGILGFLSIVSIVAAIVLAFRHGVWSGIGFFGITIVALPVGLILALQKFEGTLVFISHDVHFIRSLGTKVLHIVDGKVTAYAGDYDYYLQKTGEDENARAAGGAGGESDSGGGA